MKQINLEKRIWEKVSFCSPLFLHTHKDTILLFIEDLIDTPPVVWKSLQNISNKIKFGTIKRSLNDNHN